MMSKILIEKTLLCFKIFNSNNKMIIAFNKNKTKKQINLNKINFFNKNNLIIN